MKYTSECTINLPREKVIELFDSLDNLYKWQPSLKEHKIISGEPGAVGSKMALVYDNNGREMEMIETITSLHLPESMSMTYEAKGVNNWITNYFYKEDGKTRWVMDTEFEFTTLMMKLVGFFMRGSFPKSTQKSMNDFKKFAEQAV